MCQQQIFSQNYLSIVIHGHERIEGIINILQLDIVEFLREKNVTIHLVLFHVSHIASLHNKICAISEVHSSSRPASVHCTIQSNCVDVGRNRNSYMNASLHSSDESVSDACTRHAEKKGRKSEMKN